VAQTSRVEWHGKQILAATRQAAVVGLGTAAEHLLQVARTRVPREEGILELSGVASVDTTALTAAVSFDTPYAVRVHEEMDWHHEDGRTAKYLENPANEERSTLRDLIAAAIRRALS